MILVGYVRTSGDKQESTSLQSQRARIAAKAFADGHDLLEVFEDKESAEHADNRPGFQEALKCLREGKADGLIVFKLDRFARSVLDGVAILKEFKESSKSLVCCADPIDTTTPMGQAFFQIAMVFAELERKTIAQRCLQGQYARSEQLRYAAGAPPYGYRRIEVKGQKQLVEVPEEQEVISWARQAIAWGMSYRSVAASLNARNVPSKRGGEWKGQNVSKILNNKSGLANWVQSGCTFDYMKDAKARKLPQCKEAGQNYDYPRSAESEIKKTGQGWKGRPQRAWVVALGHEYSSAGEERRLELINTALNWTGYCEDHIRQLLKQGARNAKSQVHDKRIFYEGADIGALMMAAYSNPTST